jgi:biotin transporter BioY
VAVVINVVLSALVIGVAAWLSDRFPRATGFLVALPLATMLVLPMAHRQHQDAEKTVAFAKSILIAVPIVMLFLLPFMLAVRCGLSFWLSYVLACLWLIPAFFLHRYLLRLL